MKKAAIWLMSMLMLNGLTASPSFAAGQIAPAAQKGSKKLADLYRTGHVRLTAGVVIDSKDLPEKAELLSPADIAGDAESNLYVLDMTAGDIKKFDRTGKFLRLIGRKGQGPGEFIWPSKIAFAGRGLLAYDDNSMRFSFFGPDGNFMTSLSNSESREWVKKLRGLPDGRFIVGAESGHFGLNGGPIEHFLFFMDPKSGPSKPFHAVKLNNSKLVKLPDGVPTEVPQPYRPGVFWDVSPQGRIVVGFSDKYELELRDPARGKIGSISRTFEPAKVTPDDRKKWFASMSVSSSDGGSTKVIPEYVSKNTEFPDRKPAFDEVFFDTEGNILVHPIVASGEEGGPVFDAFSPDGKFIARVVFSGAPPIFALRKKLASAGCLWIISHDEDDYPIITGWRISE